MVSPRPLVIAFCIALAGGCATTTYRFRPGDHRLELAVQGPLRDLGVIRETPPDVLIRAAENPYALPSAFDCDANLAEITELDQILGQDLRLPGEEEGRDVVDLPNLVANMIGGAVGLPYSSIIRRITGAADRDRLLRGAILAGIVRRSFLRGVVFATGCAANGVQGSEAAKEPAIERSNPSVVEGAPSEPPIPTRRIESPQ